MLIDNPEFLRQARSRLRLSRVVLLTVIAAVVSGGLLTLLYLSATSLGSTPLINPAAMFHSYFYWITGMQLTLAGLLSFMLASQNIALERERSTLDFQRLVAIGPWRLATGKLFGAAIESNLLIVLGTFFAGIAMVGGGVSA